MSSFWSTLLSKVITNILGKFYEKYKKDKVKNDPATNLSNDGTVLHSDVSFKDLTEVASKSKRGTVER